MSEFNLLSDRRFLPIQLMLINPYNLIFPFFKLISRNIMRESRDTVTSIFSKEFSSSVISMIVQSFFHILTAKKREI